MNFLKLPQGMNTTMHIRIIGGVVLLQHLQHRDRLLRGRSIVQIHQPRPIHLLQTNTDHRKKKTNISQHFIKQIARMTQKEPIFAPTHLVQNREIASGNMPERFGGPADVDPAPHRLRHCHRRRRGAAQRPGRVTEGCGRRGEEVGEEGGGRDAATSRRRRRGVGEGGHGRSVGEGGQP